MRRKPVKYNIDVNKSNEVLHAQKGDLIDKLKLLKDTVNPFTSYNTLKTLNDYGHLEEINNNPLVQAAKIFDPTGVTSYPDVYYSGRDFSNDPSWRNAFNFGINTVSALPIIGKAAVPLKLAKGSSKTVNAANKTAETLSKIESYPVDWVIKNFEGMGSVIPSTVRKGAIGLNDLKSYLGNATTEQLNKILGNNTGRGFSNKKITKEEKINLIINGLNSVNTSSDIINTGQAVVNDIRAQKGGLINNNIIKNYNTDIEYNDMNNRKIAKYQFGDLLSTGPLADLFKSGEEWNKAWRGNIFDKSGLLNKTIYQNQKDRNADEMYGDPNSPFYDPEYKGKMAASLEAAEADWNQQYEAWQQAQLDPNYDPREWEQMNNKEDYINKVTSGDAFVAQYKPIDNSKKFQSTAQGIFTGLQYQGAYQKPEPVKLEEGFQGTQWARYGKAVPYQEGGPVNYTGYTPGTPTEKNRINIIPGDTVTTTPENAPPVTQPILTIANFNNKKNAAGTNHGLINILNPGDTKQIVGADKIVELPMKETTSNNARYGSSVNKSRRRFGGNISDIIMRNSVPNFQTSGEVQNPYNITNNDALLPILVNGYLGKSDNPEIRTNVSLGGAQTGDNESDYNIVRDSNGRTYIQYNGRSVPISNSTEGDQGTSNSEILDRLSTDKEKLKEIYDKGINDYYMPNMEFYGDRPYPTNDASGFAPFSPEYDSAIDDYAKKLDWIAREEGEKSIRKSDRKLLENWRKNNNIPVVYPKPGQESSTFQSNNNSVSNTVPQSNTTAVNTSTVNSNNVPATNNNPTYSIESQLGIAPIDSKYNPDDVKKMGGARPVDPNIANTTPAGTTAGTPNKGGTNINTMNPVANLYSIYNQALQNPNLITDPNSDQARQYLQEIAGNSQVGPGLSTPEFNQRMIANRNAAVLREAAEQNYAQQGNQNNAGTTVAATDQTTANTTTPPPPPPPATAPANKKIGAGDIKDIYNIKGDRTYEYGKDKDGNWVTRRKGSNSEWNVINEALPEDKAGEANTKLDKEAYLLGTKDKRTSSTSTQQVGQQGERLYGAALQNATATRQASTPGPVSKSSGVNIYDMYPGVFNPVSAPIRNSSSSVQEGERLYGSALQNATVKLDKNGRRPDDPYYIDPSTGYTKSFIPGAPNFGPPVGTLSPEDREEVLAGQLGAVEMAVPVPAMKIGKAAAKGIDKVIKYGKNNRELSKILKNPVVPKDYTPNALPNMREIRKIQANNSELLAPFKQGSLLKDGTVAGINKTAVGKTKNEILKLKKQMPAKDFKKLIDELKKIDPSIKYQYGGSIKKYQFGGEINSDHTFPIHPITEEFTEIQTERGETVFLPDGTIVDVKATDLHKNMDRDRVTDILPEGAYVFSNDPKMRFKLNDKIGGVKLKDMKLGKTVFEYKENEVTTGPQDIMFNDIFNGKDNLSPSEITRNIKKKFEVRDMKNDFFVQRANTENKEQRVEYLNILKTFSEFKKPKSRREIPKAQYGYSLEANIPHAGIGDLVKLSPMYWLGDYMVGKKAEKQNRKLAQERAGIWEEKGKDIKKTGAMNMLTNAGTYAASLNVPDMKYTDYGTEFATTQDAYRRAKAIQDASKYGASQGLGASASMARYMNPANMGNYLAQSAAANQGVVQNAAALEANMGLQEAEALNRYRTAGTEAYNAAANARAQQMYNANVTGLGNVGRSGTDYLKSMGDYKFDKGMDKMSYDAYLEQRKQAAKERYSNTVTGIAGGVAELGMMFVPGGALAGLGKGAAGGASNIASNLNPNATYGANFRDTWNPAFSSPASSQFNNFNFTNSTAVPGYGVNRGGFPYLGGLPFGGG